MSVLTITHDDLKRLLGITDTSSDDALNALISAEQPAEEWALDAAVLTAAPFDTGLMVTLTLGVCEVLAGRWLEQLARAPGANDDFRIGELSVSASKTAGPGILGASLIATGRARLASFRKLAKGVVPDTLSDAGVTADDLVNVSFGAAGPTRSSVFDDPTVYHGREDYP